MSEKEHQPKASKKDRHMHCVHELSKFLERVNESTVQSVLLLSRANRETLEEYDLRLLKFCADIDVEKFLIDKSEADLLGYLDELKRMLPERERIITQFGSDLDHTEVKRSEVVGVELKDLVDRLVAIAHQLPDDIQRFVEAEAFEVNKEIIRNRLQHSQTAAELQIKHVQLEFETIEKWEASRRKWRQLRHDKALEIFRADIRSDLYNDPDDRKQFFFRFREGQQQRRATIMALILKLTSMNYTNLNSEAVQAVQTKLQTCNEEEMEAIQDCYNGLARMRTTTDYLARERVEDIRRELHVYGALQVDPKLRLLADQIEVFLADPSLAELWRLGGGLKPDMAVLMQELSCDDAIYDRVVVSMLEKLEPVLASFPLKPIMVEKGRLSQLEKIRGTITKFRSAPRGELAAVLSGCLEDLEEVAGFEGLPVVFSSTVSGVVAEIREELANLEKRIAAAAAAPAGATLGAATLGTVQAQTNIAATAAGVTAAPAATAKTHRGKSTAPRTKRATGSAGTAGVGTLAAAEPVIMTYADPALVKGWYRKLAILFYGSDLPPEAQRLLAETAQQATAQRDCNRLVDAVVSAESDQLLLRMDNRYRKFLERVAAFLENQANYLFVQCGNIADMYLQLAKSLEKHRVDLKTAEDKSADELWDLSEDCRLDLEDREAAFEAACQRLRESNTLEEVGVTFAAVTEVLRGIDEQYRTYQQRSSFAADRLALYLVEQFRGLLLSLTAQLWLAPAASHPLLTEYERVWDDVRRLHASFFESAESESPIPGGVVRTAVSEEVFAAAQGPTVHSPWTATAQEGADVRAYFGDFAQRGELPELWQRFATDGAFKAPGDSAAGSDEASVEAEPPNAFVALSLYRPHATYPFFKAEGTEALAPHSDDELATMHEEDAEDYELAVLRAFVRLASSADQLPPGAVSHFPLLSALTPDQQAAYAMVQTQVERVQQRVAEQTSSDFLRSHAPLHEASQQPWVLFSELTDEELQQVYCVLRDDLLRHAEAESFERVSKAESDMRARKQALSDELDARLRSHVSRLPAVETKIKMPRQKELSVHQDKTHRMVVALQQKVADFHRNFDTFAAQSDAAVTAYQAEMAALQDQVHGQYKNLAVLQGIYQKARTCSQLFETQSLERLRQLRAWTSVDLDAMLAQARDFRKFCPRQVAGQPPVPGGNYSESELVEIGRLVEEQCALISARNADEWQPRIEQLAQSQSAAQTQALAAFNAKHAQCSQEVALAEGLGKKYGAPRRRAQERIRSEVSRDERAAGRVDELLAQSEFIAAELLVVCTSSSASSAPEQAVKSSVQEALTAALEALGTAEAHEALRRQQALWTLLLRLRQALRKRVSYLDVLGELGAPPLQQLSDERMPWLRSERLAQYLLDVPTSSSTTSAVAEEEAEVPGMPALLPTLTQCFEEVNRVCCAETRELYAAEGLTSMLQGPGGVPESLAAWLREAREKLLGRGGYQERAWKRLWAQLARLDDLLGRHRVLVQERQEAEAAAQTQLALTQTQTQTQTIPAAVSSSSSSLLSLQTACLAYYLEAAATFARHEHDRAQTQLSQVLGVWALSREKHERLLRPRLGSPDKAEELAALDAVEKQRSAEMTQHLRQFRSGLVRRQVERLRVFCEDSALLAKGLLLLLDGVFRQELLRLPPDTAVPSKHISLKKLRKAQRIREEVQRGGADRSVKRVWPGPALSADTLAAVRGAEAFVLDLGAVPSDLASGAELDAALAACAGLLVEEAPAAAAGKDKDKKGAKDAKDKDKKPAADKGKKDADKGEVAPTGTPSLLPQVWMDKLRQCGDTEALVSAAHRIVVQDRDLVLARYSDLLCQLLGGLTEQTQTLLSQEQSWNARWDRQVAMLRQGSL